MTSPIVIPVPGHPTSEPAAATGDFSVCCAPVPVEDYPVVHHPQDLRLEQVWTPSLELTTTQRDQQLAAEARQHLRSAPLQATQAHTHLLQRILHRALTYISQPDSAIPLPQNMAGPQHPQHHMTDLLGIPEQHFKSALNAAHFLRNTKWPEGTCEETVNQAELRQRILALPHDENHFVHLDDPSFAEFFTPPNPTSKTPQQNQSVSFDVIRERGKNTLAVHSVGSSTLTADSPGWSWGPAKYRRSFLPGIIHDGIILTRPQWRFDFAEKNDFSFRTWLHHHDLFGYGYLGENENQLVLDLRCKHHIPIALACLPDTDYWVTAAPHVTELGSLKSPHGKHATRLRIAGSTP